MISTAKNTSSTYSGEWINYLNIGLMLISLVAAYILPFELFLFSYAVLGPLHYLTEISWLDKKNYFIRSKDDMIFLLMQVLILTNSLQVLCSPGLYTRLFCYLFKTKQPNSCWLQRHLSSL